MARISRKPIPPSRQFTSIVAPKRTSIIPDPFGQPGCSCRRTVHIKQVCHQAADFFPCDRDIPEASADHLAAPISDQGRDGEDRTPHAYEPADCSHQLAIGECLRPDDIDDHVVTPCAVFHGQIGQIFNIDGLKPVLPIAEDTKYRPVPQNPGDVVDQDVFLAKEKSLETIRMARALARNPGKESDYAFEFEEPAFLTLGLCYENRPRFSGSAYQPVLRRVEEFIDQSVERAIRLREQRAASLLALDDKVAAIVKKLQARGFKSPCLKMFVIARINPIRFSKAASFDFDEVLSKMEAAADRFNLDKVREEDIARSGGPAGAD